MYSDMKILKFKDTVLKSTAPVTNIDENKTGNLRFYGGQQSIFIPDKTINEYYEEEKAVLPGKCAIKVVEKLLIDNEILQCGTGLTDVGLIVFYLLHEEGHYIHYMGGYVWENRSFEEYLDDYEKQTVEYKTKFLNICGKRRDEWAYVKSESFYREKDFERIADIYAIEKIKENSQLLEFFKVITPY